MGLIAHHAIVVTGNSGPVRSAHMLALAAFGTTSPLVTEITETATNDTASFLVAPDGSKEYWAESDQGDANRAQFIQTLRDTNLPFVYWVLVRFGGDDGHDLTRVEDHGQADVAEQLR